ncbi:MAG: 30S ribosomal protein S17 [Acidobacteriota bacterium]|jgi:small subunit ribosomal protein S17
MAEAEKASAARGRQQRKVGLVVSDRMDKSIRVAVERLVTHPRYKKRVRRTSTFMAHDEKNECRIGDKVAIVESRPLSRRKRWRVSAILERAAGSTESGPAGS